MQAAVLLLSLLLLSVQRKSSAAGVTFHVEENGSQPDLLVGNVKSDDCVAPFNSFNIESNKFSLDSGTGDIKTKIRLDREQRAAYSFHVICGDSVVSVTVLVDDKNDCYPTFQNASIMLRRPESIPTPTSLPLTYVEDLDSPENSIDRVEVTSGNDDNRFSVQLQAQSGRPTRFDVILVLQTPLDYESAALHQLQLTAFDKRGLTAIASVTIYVDNVNDEKPIFSLPLYSANVSENATVGTEILQVRATDRDLGDFNTVRYYINYEVSDPNRHFRIDPVSGSIRLDKPLDYELRQLHSVVVIATDGVNNSTANVIVRIADINDRPPQITFLNLTTGSLTQNAMLGQPIIRVEVRDPDRPTDPVEVRLSAPFKSFKLVPLETNIFVIQVDAQLSPRVYKLVLTATDAGNPPLSVATTIDIPVLASNDHVPVFQKPIYHVATSQSVIAGNQLIRVLATDPDGTAVSYSLTASPADKGLFDIDASTGWVKIGIRPLSCGSFTVQLHARDAGTPQKTGNATLVVFVTGSNQYPPRFSKPFYSVSLPTVSVSSCFSQVQAADRDCGAALSYTFQSSMSDAYGPAFESAYSIDSYTGYICVKNATRVLAFGSWIDFPMKVVDSAAGVTRESYSLIRLVITDATPSSGFTKRFPFTSYRLDISENYPVHSVLVDVAAIGGSEYFLAGASSHFALYVNGTLALTNPLDYENGPREFSLTVNSPGVPGNLIVSLHVVNENDNYPDCSGVVKELSVADSSKPFSKIAQLNCQDPDNGPGPFYAGNFDHFILSTSGALTVRDSLTHLAGETVGLFVRACDPDNQCVNFTLSINIYDTNDHAPVFSQPAGYWFKVKEGAAVGSRLGATQATDRDLGANGLVKYSLLSSTDVFTIGSTDGVLKTAVELDREKVSSYSVQIVAHDSGSPSRSTTVQAAVVIQDVNDVAPRFRLPQYQISVSDLTPVASTLIVVDAADPDLGIGGSLFYFLKGAAAEFVSVHRITGVISVTKQLPVGTLGGQLTVYDGEGLSSYALLSITVNSVPEWPNTTVTMAVSESASVGSLVGQILSPSQKTYYTILKAADGAIWLSVNSGNVYINRPLDRETAPYHDYEVLMTDAAEKGLGRPQTARVALRIYVLDENDNSPEFPELARFPTIIVAEDTPSGSVVFSFDATDADFGLNGTIRYQLASASSIFYLDETTGKLFIRQALDRETTGERVQVGIIAVDNCQEVPMCFRTEPAVLTVIIKDINEHTPSLSFDGDAFYIVSDEPDAIIAHVEGVDQDSGANGSISYSLSQETEAKIDNYGLIRLQAPNTQLIVVNVTVMDGVPGSLGRSNWKVHTIPIKTLSSRSTPKFSKSAYSVSISSRSSKGQDVLQLQIKPFNGPVDFRIPSGLLNNLFVVDSVSGQVRLGRTLPQTVSSQSAYSLTAIVSDRVNPLQLDLCEVSITLLDSNDHSPTFLTAYYTEVPEGQAFTDILTLAAYDLDRGPAGYIIYSMEGSNGRFILDPRSGRLSCAALDSQVASQYLLNITATDGGGRTGRTTATIRILPVNRFAPTFQSSRYTASVSESAPVGTSIVNVTALDRDTGENGRVGYAILGKSDTFSLNPDTGEIKLAKPLDKERQPFVSIVVKAVDGSPVNPMSSLVSVDVEILDGNDQRPIFQQTYYSLRVSRSLAVGSLLTTLRATDDDSSPGNSAVSYSIEKNDYVAVNSATGQATLIRSLSAGEAVYSFAVRASDSGTPRPLHSETVLLLQLGAPLLVFVSANYSASLAENSPPGRCVLDAAASARCLSVATVPPASQYKIVGGNEDQLFAIDSTTGRIETSSFVATNALDYEKRRQYQLVVQASTGDQAALTRVDIQILNADDSQPYCVQPVYSAVLSEKSPAGTPVVQVTAVDLDSAVKYRLLPSDTFEVDEDTGLVSVKTPPDFTLQSSHSLTLVAASVDDPLTTAKCSVLVRIINRNNQKPLLQDIVDPVVVNAETARPGQKLLQVRATDLDGYPPLIYTLSPPSDTFAMGLFSGEFWLTAKPQLSVYNFTVSSSDSEHTVSKHLTVRVDSATGGVRFGRRLYVFTLAKGAPTSQLVGKLDLSPASTAPDAIVSILSDPDRPALPFRLIGFDLYPSQPISAPGDHVFAVKATSAAAGGGEDYATVRVTVQAANRFPPVFTVSTSLPTIPLLVSEATKPGRTVGRVACSDADSDQFVSVAVVETSSPVQAVRHTGRLVLTRQLDREAQAEHSVSLVCWDSGEPRLTASVTVRILVQDANDNAPVFVGEPYSATVPADSVVSGGRLLRVAATDADSGVNGIVSYKILLGGGSFAIDAATGDLTLTALPPAIVASTGSDVVMNLLVQASDSSIDVPARSSLTRVSVRFAAASALPSSPRFPINPLVFLVKEGLSPGTLVGNLAPPTAALTATDCVLTADSSTTLFSLTNGSLRTRQVLDYENQTTFTLRLNCSADARLVIMVEDVDEFQPNFDKAEYAAGFSSTPRRGRILLRVVAFDADGGPAGRIGYSLVGEDGAALVGNLARFGINASTGEVYMARDFDGVNGADIADDTATIMKNFSLLVRASSGTLYSDASIRLQMPVPLTSHGLGGVSGSLLIAVTSTAAVLLVIIAIIIAIVVYRRCYRRQAKGMGIRSPPSSTVYDSCFDHVPPLPPPRTLTELTRLSAAGTTHSSGLGSSEEEQQRMMMDTDSSNCSLPKDHREYLYRLGVRPPTTDFKRSGFGGSVGVGVGGGASSGGAVGGSTDFAHHSSDNLWSEDVYQTT
uniref:Cadherin domain-containing protein n=1 Tax=Macrostomum lignano TaxID=282301 RepID=A0A1I8GRF3_9PLAT